VQLAAAQKSPDAEIGQLATRRDVGFVPDEYVPGIWIAAERPPVSVWGCCKALFFPLAMSPVAITEKVTGPRPSSGL
jgi:hypothetical protein